MSEISEKEIEAAIKAIEAVPIMNDTYSLSGEDAKAVARAALEAAACVRAENDAFRDAAVTGLGVMYTTNAGAIRHLSPTVYRAEDVEPHPAPQPSGTVEALKRIAQLKEVRRGGGVFDYEPALSAMEMYEIAFDALSALTSGKPHPDDEAVDRFASAMKAKLKWEREERERHGWNDPEVCSEKYLARLLIEHLAKGNDGNFEDVANFCMMLHQRGAHPRVLADAFTAGKPEQVVTKREIIVAAAISHNGLICTIPQPARHHHILHRSGYSSAEEGFLTSEGRFVDRKKAAELAIKAGQIDQLRWPPYLYSEDLW